MLLSYEFLLLAQSQNTYFLYQTLSSRSYRSITSQCQYADPNYGACWFKVKTFPLSSAEEVILRGVKYVAWNISWHADMYYQAMKRAAIEGDAMNMSPLNAMYCHYSYAFPPDLVGTTQNTMSAEKKTLLLFGTSQIEA